MERREADAVVMSCAWCEELRLNALCAVLFCGAVAQDLDTVF